MKYCSFYYNKLKFNFPLINEFKIRYKANEEKLFLFLDYTAEGDRRVIIRMTEEDIQDIILSNRIQQYIDRENKNFAFLLPSITTENAEIISLFRLKLQQNNIEFFFEDKVYSIDKIWELIDLGVSDVYVCGELGFELKQISGKIHEAGVNIRVFPDVAQSSGVVKESIKQFFIRPEDVPAYEEYVDICEFYEEEVEGKIELLYLAYCQDGEWTSKISDIISGLDCHVHGACVTQHFGKFRTKCGKKCMKDGDCNMCISAIRLAETLGSRDLRLRPVQDKTSD